MHGGRRPKSLEGGNRGEVCAGGGVRLWGFSAGVCSDFSISNGKLIDGMSGILGYVRAYRPMALSSPAVVGAAESTPGGQAGSARSE
jgi:hypothetical protein